MTFYPDGHYDLKIEMDRNIDYFLTPGHRPEADHSKYMIVRGALVRNTDGIISTFEDGKVEENTKFDHIAILSSFDRYYASVFFNFNRPFKVVVTPDGKNDPLPFIAAHGSMDIKGYIGPKEWKLFKTLDPRLTDAIEFGWFTFLSKPFFSIMLTIHNFVGNWGWAIVIFTILVKLVLFPLSYKGMMSMQKLKDLAPKMKEIKERYGKDPAKMNQQMMELYRKHGANPMGGCLPMLLQIPVFFALYRVLLNADELQGASWILWIGDLSRQDPWFVLPVLMGVTMFVQQQITPNQMTDPMQQKIFKWFPVLMTFFFLTFPSGLVLYWLTNNVLSIAQQYYINKAYDRYKAGIKASGHPE
jgi:YidC/Oxa1 family membrane protein insertase